MLGITPFGLFHTLISLVSLFTGLYALLRFGRILDRQHSGQVYIWGTVGSCVTGFFIVRHGGFSQAHALGISTLLALAAGWWLGRNAKPGSLKQIASTLAYTLTVFFHFIPGFNETLVRVPVGDPVISGPEDPKLLALVGSTFLVFLVVMAIQVIRLRRGALQAVSAA